MVFRWFKKAKDPQKTKTQTEKQAGEKAEANKKIGSSPEDDTIKQEKDLLLQEAQAVPNAQSASRQGDHSSPDSETRQSDGFFKRLKSRLSKTRRTFDSGLDSIFEGKTNLDDDLLEALEELLLTADIGVQTTLDLIQRVSKTSSKISTPNQLKETLRDEIIALFETQTTAPAEVSAKPRVIMVVGVNGVGKTTTIGKLAAKSVAAGKNVLIAACDTFRAAAVEQLTIWAERAGADIVKHKDQADPSAVAYDCIEAAAARGTDLVFIDTAGRLHTKTNLMEELKKMKRTIAKKLPGAPHDILLVLDATTGQNALSQAKMFDEALGVTGIALTKLDGTAKGGIVVGISHTLNLPLQYIGIGEKIEDLQDFDPKQFVSALF